MKKILILAMIGVVAWTPAKADSNWELVWADEFNHPGMPDPSKWTYEHGFIRNHEKQYYTKGRAENARVEEGMLVIEGRREDFRAKSGDTARYTSASLIAKNPMDWLYGRIEMRAKLPQGRGVWPALWMVGSDLPRVGWPECGEIDIMEFVGKEPGNIYSTLHYQAAGLHRMNQKRLSSLAPSDDFHVYAMEWLPERIEFFFDGNRYQSIQTDVAGTGADNPFRKPQRLIINLALGGSWGGEIDDSALPQKYLIDYVRIYRRPEMGARN
ncbi:MAG TPA: glycoside hydrolase family 16 protein [Opitutaceae bacterium]|jgi:beta-glucanase (GH16 family)|nr:glycoside hydrolase family 16 protein [Opitutaceae bacterium]